MGYTVELQPAARRQLAKLEFGVQRRLIGRMEELENDPRPPGCKKLAGKRDLYRIRVGHYRVIYEIRDEVLLVLVVKIGHRSKVYD